MKEDKETDYEGKQKRDNMERSKQTRNKEVPEA